MDIKFLGFSVGIFVSRSDESLIRVFCCDKTKLKQKLLMITMTGDGVFCNTLQVQG